VLPFKQLSLVKMVVMGEPISCFSSLVFNPEGITLWVTGVQRCALPGLSRRLWLVRDWRSTEFQQAAVGGKEGNKAFARLFSLKTMECVLRQWVLFQ